MTHTTEQERADFEAWYIAGARKSVPAFAEWSEIELREGCMRPDSGSYRIDYARIAWDAWQAARRAPAVPVPQIDPVHGDCLPPIGSRVFIRHGRDDDAHACIVTGYYAWGDLNGSKHLHRVFVHLVYEGTDTKQARMLCDCYATAEEALAAAPQPPEADMGIPISVAAPVRLPEPVGCTTKPWGVAWNTSQIEAGTKLYTEQQVRQLLAAHGIKEQST